MKARVIMLGLLVVIVVALIGYLYFVSHRDHAQAPPMEGIEETVKLAKNIQQMQATATQNLGRAEKIAEHIEQMRQPLLSADRQPDPFVGQPDEESEPPPPPVPEAETPAKLPAEVPEEAQPEAPPEESWPEMTLTGVVLAGDDSLAVINEDLYAVGDVIEGFKIMAVEQGRVELVEAMTGRRRALEIVAWDMKGMPDEE